MTGRGYLHRHLWILVVAALALGCDSDSPTAPSPTPTPTPTPTPQTFTLSGQVTDADNGASVPNATIEILDGDHAGTMATTGADGRYSIPDVAGNMNVEITATGYTRAREGFEVTTTTTRNFQLERMQALTCVNVVSIGVCP